MPTNEPKPPASRCDHAADGLFTYCALCNPKLPASETRCKDCGHVRDSHQGGRYDCRECDGCVECSFFREPVPPPTPEPAGTTVEELAEKVGWSLAEMLTLQLPENFPDVEIARRVAKRVSPILRADREARERESDAFWREAVAQARLQTTGDRERIEELTRQKRYLMEQLKRSRKVVYSQGRGIEELTRERDDALRLLKFPVYSEPVKALLARLDAPERPAEPPVPVLCVRCDGPQAAPYHAPETAENRLYVHAFVDPRQPPTPSQVERHVYMSGLIPECAAAPGGVYCGKPASDPVHQVVNTRWPNAPIHQGAEPQGHRDPHYRAPEDWKARPPAEGPGEEFARKSARLYAILDEATKLVATWPAWKREHFTAPAPAAPGSAKQAERFCKLAHSQPCAVCPPTPAEAKENER